MHDPGYLCYPPRPSSLSLAPTVALKASFGTKRGIYEFFLVLPVAGRGFRGEDGIHRVFCGETLNAFKAGGQGAGWGVGVARRGMLDEHFYDNREILALLVVPFP